MNEQDELERLRAENERLREANKRMRQVLDAIFCASGPIPSGPLITRGPSSPFGAHPTSQSRRMDH